MKYLMNFSVSEDDLRRYSDPEDLCSFYREHGLDGLELMPLDGDGAPLVRPDMTVGVHLCCIDDWIDQWWDLREGRERLLEHYRKQLDLAQSLGAEYVVYHVSQMNVEETLGEPFIHTDEEVAEAACELINELLDGKDYTFLFLMENMWYPGLRFLRPEIPRQLLDGIHYQKKGFMLDTGHFMHTNLDLNTQEEAVSYILDMLEEQKELVPYICGLHLHQSLTGAYVKEFMENRPPIETDPDKRFTQLFMHVFKVDLHLPFTAAGVKKVVETAAPEFVTLEYITDSRQTHARYLEEGRLALQ